MTVVLLSVFACSDHDSATTCRELFEAGKKDGSVIDDEYKQSKKEYKQALVLIQTLEKRLPRTKTSGENKSSIKEVYVVCRWVGGCG